MQFLTLLKKGNSLQKEDFQALVKLHETFPYFPIPKILAAKYEMAKTGGKSQELLHWASIQSPNRAWLKELIENDIDFLNPSPAPGSADNTKTEEGKAESQNTAPEDAAKEQGTAKPSYNRKEILKKLEENLNRFKNPIKKVSEKEHEPNSEPSELPSRKSTAGEDLIETIKKKEKKVILDARKIEQNDIIKAFSKKNIHLGARGNEDPGDLEDLSEESTVFHDKLVSESFAKLLVQQDKKDKAIEIYQKLILKFPEKSAYFADLIKKLKD